MWRCSSVPGKAGSLSPTPNHNTTSWINWKSESRINQPTVFFLIKTQSSLLYLWAHVPFISFPSAPSCYLRRTAPAPASSTSWGQRACQASPPSQRRSAVFPPRGSAPSVHARTAWLTATRSQAADRGESLWNVENGLIIRFFFFLLPDITDHLRLVLCSTVSNQVTFRDEYFKGTPPPPSFQELGSKLVMLTMIAAGAGPSLAC